MDRLAAAGASPTFFKDAYIILEEVQSYAEYIEPYSDAIVACHWAIQNLERIHRTQAQNPYSAIVQDVSSLRGKLDRFNASCHTLIRFLNSITELSSQVGCFIGGGRTSHKRKQVRELQEEFWDHQRILSLVLANAIYMTTLDIQRDNAVPDPELEIIIQKAQKRHTVYEKTDRTGQENKSGKPAESYVEHLEWEVCLRKYFEYVEKHANKNAGPSCRVPMSQRRKSEPMLSQMTPGAMVRYDSHRDQCGDDQLHHNGGSGSGRIMITCESSKETHSYNEIYTRTRRNSTISRASSISAQSRNNSMSSIQSVQTVTTSAGLPSPAIPGPFPWDHSNSNPSSPLLQSTRNSTRAPGQDLARIWKDIAYATQTMSVLEARAYIEGRLTGLDPETIAEVRRAMSTSQKDLPGITLGVPLSAPSSPPAERTPVRSHWEAHSAPSAEDRSPPLQIREPSPTLTSARSMPVIKSSSEIAGPIRAPSEPLRPSNASKRHGLRRQSSQKRIANLRADHARQLSTIVERPSTSRSRGGESIKSRKSIFSLKKEKPPPLPEKALPMTAEERNTSADGSFSSDSSTLRGSTSEEKRIIELEEVPEEPSPLPDISKTSRGIALSSSTNLSKPLPMTPDEVLGPGSTDTLASTSSVKSRLSKLFSAGRSRQNRVNLPSTMSTPVLASHGAGMRSHETLGHLSNASLEQLCKSGRNGSKSTLLVAYQEGPDQPFQVWLNALPYIEGRAGSGI